MTPLYLGFISNFLGFIRHPNKNREDPQNEELIPCLVIYSIIRGLLMVPYIILFFPFMAILYITNDFFL